MEDGQNPEELRKNLEEYKSQQEQVNLFEIELYGIFLLSKKLQFSRFAWGKVLCRRVCYHRPRQLSDSTSEQVILSQHAVHFPSASISTFT